MAKYQEANYPTLRKVPPDTRTSNPPERQADLRLCYHREDRAGGSCEKSCHEEGAVSYQFYHFATGWGVLPNGEKFERNMNCVNTYTLGGKIDINGGNETKTMGGEISTAAAGKRSHYGSGKGPKKTPNSEPARSTIQESCDVASSLVWGGDGGIIAGSTLGIAAQEINMCSVGNFNFGSVEGTAALVGEGNASVGSKNGATQVGGKGVSILAQGGPLSAESSGQMSLYTTGANIVISSGGGMVYINSSNAPPKTVDDVVKETGKKGAGAVKSPKVIDA